MSAVYIGVMLAVIVFGALAEHHPGYRMNRNGTLEIIPDIVFAFLLTMVLVLVSGLRYRVGTDFLNYYQWRIYSWKEIWIRFLNYQDPGFAILAKLSRSILNRGQTLIFISALITIGLCSRTIYHYSPMYLVSMLLYLFLGQWQSGFNTIRQCIAGAIIFAGHRYIINRDWIRYGIVIFIASLFHFTAFVMIIPFFLLTRKTEIKLILIMAVGSVIIRFSYDFIFSLIGIHKGRMLNVAETRYFSNNVNVFRIFVAFIPVILFFLFCRKENLTKEETFYVNAVFFHAFSMLAAMGSTYFGRIQVYTGAATTIGIGFIFLLIDDKRIRKFIIFAGIILYGFYWIYSLKGINNYQWIF